MARAGIEATHVHSMGTIWALGIIVASFPAYDKRKALADAAVTTALRNEAPRLLALARAGERLAEAARAYAADFIDLKNDLLEKDVLGDALWAALADFEETRHA